jgi:hypothetical protein
MGERTESEHDGLAAHDPSHHHLDERAAGRVMMGTIFFFLVVGIGVGVFFEQPWIGAAAGAAVGILIGLWLVPRLLRDWID